MLKKIIIVLLILCLTISSTSITYANEEQKNTNIKLWYPSKANYSEFESVTVCVPNNINNIQEFAIKSLLEGKGLNDNVWNEIPNGIVLKSLEINNNVAELNFDSTLLEKINLNHSIYLIINSIKRTLFEFNNIDSFVIKVNDKKIDEINEYILDIDSNRNIINVDKLNTSSSGVSRGVVVPNPVIYLDAGHGGTAPGAVGADGTKEADINLQIALKVRDYLQGQGATVIMSRTGNITKDMDTRVSEANSANVNFIVTIHCNSSTNSSAHGYQTFYTSTHQVNSSSELAQSIDSRLQYTQITRFGTPTTHDGIGLLLYTNAPAVLIETAFMSNSSDLQILKNSTQQSNIAFNIFVGIRKWWWGN